MNSVKIGTLVIASFFALNSFAQENKVEKVERAERAQITPEQMASQQTERFNKKISLTEEQKSQIQNINLGVNAKNKAIRENKEMSKEMKAESLKQNNGAREAMIKGVLTQEQLAKWNNIQNREAARKESRGGQKHSHAGGHEGHKH